jgi:hypothetical protein
MAEDTEPVKKVTVKALKFLTHKGEEHQEGDTFEVDETDVENLKAIGMAAPVE